MNQIIKITGADTVGVSLSNNTGVPFGHKIALRDIKKGENVMKYGFPIGCATGDIPAGAHVHSHNLKTNLSGLGSYEYQSDKASVVTVPAAQKPAASFMGYRRGDGRTGIRNEIWIVPTVGCVNQTAELLAKQAAERFAGQCEGFFALPHPFGCSQLGDDQKNTQKILKGLVEHPNAGGVLVLGLGCENNNIPAFQTVLGEWDERRVKFLNAQDEPDEIEAGLALIGELVCYAQGFVREKIGADELVIGLKCGGSDAFSGITANPLVGRITDRITAMGGSALLTEVPEMFGAETLLMERCQSRVIFDKTVVLINQFKEYFLRYDQPVYENPSPGNKEGGITTLEEKSLGCTQKSGSAPVVDVLEYGERIKTRGLNLLQGPGNDIVAATTLMAAGAHMILFTTGRGTPLGTFVPTLKISSNTALTRRKENWIDFDAGALIAGKSMDDLANGLFSLVLQVASGEKAKNEEYGYRQIAVWKDGVTL